MKQLNLNVTEQLLINSLLKAALERTLGHPELQGEQETITNILKQLSDETH